MRVKEKMAEAAGVDRSWCRLESKGSDRINSNVAKRRFLDQIMPFKHNPTVAEAHRD